MLKHMLFSGGSGIQGDPWVATFDNSHYNDFQSVAVAPDGSVYACGNTNYDLLLVKFSSSGTVQWQKTLGNDGYTIGYSVAVAPDGSVYVCECTNYDLLLVKFSSSGTVQWQKILDSSGNVFGYSVAVAPDGSVYVCGDTKLASNEKRCLLLAKFSSPGTVQWQKTFSGNGDTSGCSVAVAPDDSVYVCGYTNSGKYRDAVLLLVKFSSSGTVQWQKTFSGRYSVFGESVAVAPDGSVYVCGHHTGNEDILLAKITDVLIEKDVVTFGSFTFQDTSLTLENVSFTSTSPSMSVSNAGLTVKTSSLTMGTPSFTTNLYTYKE